MGINLKLNRRRERGAFGDSQRFVSFSPYRQHPHTLQTQRISFSDVRYRMRKWHCFVDIPPMDLREGYPP
jgi:hypothetical protein